ncbi:MAG: glycosyltransferase family 9 protein, partial [Saprospiraceae bacterium]
YENGFENFINLLKELQDENFDMAVVPSAVVFSATNHLIAHYSKARIKVGAASINNLDNKASSTLNIKSHFMWDTKKTHQIERNLDIIRQLNINPPETKIIIELTSEQKEYADTFITENFGNSNKLLIAFHPGAAKQDNVWPAENFAELANNLNDKYNIDLIISEGPDDEKYVRKLESLLKERYSHIRFVKHKGKLMDNAAVINKCSLLITNDTGITHLVSGMCVPIIALFGPTDAKIWGPIGENKISIQSAEENIQKIKVEYVHETAIKVLNISKIAE